MALPPFPWIDVVILLAMILLNGVFAMSELAIVSSRKARLEAIPWTRFTVEAQAQLERDGALRQRRLGTLGTVDTAGVTEVETDEDEQPEEKVVKEKE